ncbi:MAG: single-stranded-DNA-specific exonuclease RecJ [Candidatus Moraniibacteriota bacterium]
MAKWLSRERVEIPLDFSPKVHAVVGQILFSRGLETDKEIQAFMAPDYQTDSHNPFLFHDMEKLVERIRQAQECKEKVIIFGDYDADGITSSAILKETFTELGVDAEVYIPDKRTEGYGLNLLAIDIFKIAGVKLIITVDCGITSLAETQKAREYGIDIIITDHHHVPESLPNAYAIINPHQAGCGYPFADLAGVGVAFKVVQAIFERLMPEKIGQTKWMLDLVSIGTIADCVPLIGENRLFVKYGLVVLSKTRRVGLLELFTVGRIVIDESVIPDTKKVSFYIAPRINAAGRINHANLAYNLIIEKNVIHARAFALELEANNTERQKITAEVVNEIKSLAEGKYKNKKIIFAVGQHFPIGVVGLVAGKIVQLYGKPTAVFQKGTEESKGSFRSIPQINIIEAIGKCRDLLIKFGGHSQAAGVSVRNDQLENFQKTLDEIIEKQLEGIELEAEIIIDGEITPREINFDLVADLEKLRPFGIGNIEPVLLIKNLIITQKRFLGSEKKHVKFFLVPAEDNAQGNGEIKILEAISFGGAERLEALKEGSRVDVLCNVQKDEWNGNSRIQLNVVDMRIVEIK